MIQTKSAKTHIGMDGALQFTMLPFANMLTALITSDLEKIIPRENWGYEERAFGIIEGVTLDIACLDETNVEAQSLADYWNGTRNLPTEKKLQYFRQLVSRACLLEWWDAYDKTRIPLPQAPDILHKGEPEDPNSDGSGGTNTPEAS